MKKNKAEKVASYLNVIYQSGGVIKAEDEARLAELILEIPLTANQCSKAKSCEEEADSIRDLVAMSFLNYVKTHGVQRFVRDGEVEANYVNAFLIQSIENELIDAYRRVKRHHNHISASDLCWEDENEDAFEKVPSQVRSDEMVEMYVDYVAALHSIDNSIDAIICYLYRNAGFKPQEQMDIFHECGPDRALEMVIPALKEQYPDAPEGWLEPIIEKSVGRREWDIRLNPKNISKTANRVEEAIRQALNVA